MAELQEHRDEYLALRNLTPEVEAEVKAAYGIAWVAALNLASDLTVFQRLKGKHASLVLHELLNRSLHDVISRTVTIDLDEVSDQYGADEAVVMAKVTDAERRNAEIMSRFGNETELDAPPSEGSR